MAINNDNDMSYYRRIIGDKLGMSDEKFNITDFVTVNDDYTLIMVSTVDIDNSPHENFVGRVYVLHNDNIEGWISQFSGRKIEVTTDDIRSFVSSSNDLNVSDVSGSNHSINITNATKFSHGIQGAVVQVFKFEGTTYMSTSKKIDGRVAKWIDQNTFETLWNECVSISVDDVFPSEIVTSSNYFNFAISHPSLMVSCSYYVSRGNIILVGQGKSTTPGDEFNPDYDVFNYEFYNEDDEEESKIYKYLEITSKDFRSKINNTLQNNGNSRNNILEYDFMIIESNDGKIFKLMNKRFYEKLIILGHPVEGGKNIPLTIMKSYNMYGIIPGSANIAPNSKAEYLKILNTNNDMEELRKLEKGEDFYTNTLESILLSHKSTDEQRLAVNTVDKRRWNIFLNLLISYCPHQRPEALNAYEKVEKIYHDLAEILIKIYENKGYMSDFFILDNKDIKTEINKSLAAYNSNSKKNVKTMIEILKTSSGGNVYKLYKSNDKKVKTDTYNKRFNFDFKNLDLGKGKKIRFKS